MKVAQELSCNWTWLDRDSVVEISFDKVVGELFIDSTSLVRNGAMVGGEWRNFANLTCSDHSKLLSQTPSNNF